MSDAHERLRDDVAAYALGTLEPTDAARVEDHLLDCAACRVLLREYAAVYALLPFAVPSTPPPPAAWPTIRAQLGRGARAPGAARGWPRLLARPRPPRPRDLRTGLRRPQLRL